MKVAIVGPGAIGCLFGAMLSGGGHEVWLVDHDPERARLLARQGLKVSGLSGEITAPVHATAAPADVGEAGLVVVSVKSYHTEAAAEAAAPLVGPGTAALTVQNGLGNIETLARRLGEDRVVGGVTSQAATLLSPGCVRHAGRGPTVVGELDGRLTERVRKLAAALAAAGLEGEATADINAALWAKLAVNAGINPVAALARVRNGALVESPHLRSVLRAAVKEVQAVARGKGIALPASDMADYAEQVCRRTADNINSMLQDIDRGRRTEVDAINGAVAAEGERIAVPTPTNAMLAALVRGLEQTASERVAR
jgi:2-dehydropantoate 2-reductase